MITTNATFTVENGTTPLPEPFPPVDDLSAYDPTPRSRKVTGQVVSSLEADTHYVNCTGSPDWNSAQHITWQSKSFPSQIRGSKDVWIGGLSPTDLADKGPRTDGNDLLQIKRYPYTGAADELPDDVTIRWVRFHDVSRPAGSDFHPDGIQIMAGNEIKIVECRFERCDVQPVFFRHSGSPGAGGGDITNCLVESCYVEKPPTGYYTVIFYSDYNRVRNCLMRNCRLGANGRINQLAYDNGCRAENLMKLDGTPFVPGYVKS